MTVQAHAAMSAKGKLHPFKYESCGLGPFDVEVRITHCGICHSDLHLIDNDWGVSSYPLVPGHEIVGHVSARGAEVRGLEPGQRVGIGWQCGACLECDLCVAGEDHLCPRNQPTCVGHHGGFADKVVVDSRYAFPIPERLASENAAPLLCGGVTVYSPMRHYGVQPRMKVGVIGIGGLGHLALQFARALGCEVTAFSSSPEKEKEARTFGAHHFVASTDSSALKEAAGSVDFLLSTVFADLDWGGYLDVLRPNGKLCFVGAAAGPITFSIGQILGGQKSLCASVTGSRWMIREMLDFAARHGIEARIELAPMSEVNAALDKLRENRARYRMVLHNGQGQARQGQAP